MIDGLDTTVDGAVWFLQYGSSTSKPSQSAVRVDGHVGRGPQIWNLTPLNLNLGVGRSTSRATITAIGNDAAAVVRGDGRALRVGVDGTITKPVDTEVLSVADVVNLPTLNEILVDGSRGGVFIDTQNWVTRTNDPLFPVIETAAATSDGSFLVGNDVFQGANTLYPLSAGDRSAELCDLATRDMSHAEWATYVGSVAKQRPLCASTSLSQTYSAGSQADFTLPPTSLLVATPAQVSTLAADCSFHTTAHLASVSTGTLRWVETPKTAANGRRSARRCVCRCKGALGDATFHSQIGVCVRRCRQGSTRCANPLDRSFRDFGECAWNEDVRRRRYDKRRDRRTRNVERDVVRRVRVRAVRTHSLQDAARVRPDQRTMDGCKRFQTGWPVPARGRRSA